MAAQRSRRGAEWRGPQVIEELRAALERIEGLPATAPRPAPLAQQAATCRSTAEMARARDAGTDDAWRG